MSPTENENVITIKWNGVADCMTYQSSLQNGKYSSEGICFYINLL
ncbi:MULTISPECIES: hypothetical protein [Bacteroidales]|uniref:Uncharacterized protein n=5 Tax=Bacteroides TaxID=816 RepID=A0AAP3STH5_BACOV|nr:MULTISPECIES: hypothetical protein [Bacteroidales]EDN87459.1 hypothetical protein PARMER_01224 [Parabacteroides merdae ATCC 43184]EDO53933.1 hypothetical protein BACUNI_02554 [Bacteroides uniformis ATCC 8492]EDS13842.1 hypothetical protein BACSTE_02984 [Bacteroides stercoris ATCC 43183]EXZ31164.1 hypothetical protein M136_5083 [Bacteroides fragilis str. S36L11]EYA83838.1 hypothetical protein M137_4164 [Bacteroides fragilis str. S36L12]EYA89616.1 hypothetical protein M135_3760 [Bacteroides 